MLIEELSRVFKIGSLTLDDPAPHLPPEEAVKLYGNTFTQVLYGTLNSPSMNSKGQLEYEVKPPPVDTKG